MERILTSTPTNILTSPISSFHHSPSHCQTVTYSNKEVHTSHKLYTFFFNLSIKLHDSCRPLLCLEGRTIHHRFGPAKDGHREPGKSEQQGRRSGMKGSDGGIFKPGGFDRLLHSLYDWRKVASLWVLILDRNDSWRTKIEPMETG